MGIRQKLSHFNRIAWGVILTIGLYALSTISVNAAYQSAKQRQIASRYPGTIALDEGPFQFEARLTPSVAQVGDIVALEMSMLNRTANAISPRGELVLPETVTLDTGRLPTGVTYSFQDRRLSWSPVLNGQGGISQAAVYLTVNRMRPDDPEQEIEIGVWHNNYSDAVDLTLWVGTAPQGSFSMTPARASVGQPIQLTADMQGSGPFGQVWSLGDGRVVPAENPIVVFPQEGSYEIELQLSNPLQSHISTGTVVVVPEPAAFFSLSDSSPAVGEPVTFVNQGGGAAPLEYTWDFGDGSFSTDPNPTHHYPVEGRYTVVMTVRNAHGQAQNFIDVVVGQKPVADAVVDPRAAAGDPVLGLAYIDDSAETVVWDMGDGTVYEGESVEHTYRSRGSYVVSVDVINLFGETTISRLVEISDGLFSNFLPFIGNQTASSGNQVAIENDEEEGASETELLTNTLELIESDAEIVLAQNEEVSGLPLTVQLLTYINAAREAAGVSPVAELEVLSNAAQTHTDDMATARFTGHTGSDGSHPYERLARTGYRGGGYAGEATAWGFSEPVDAVQFWLDSPPHRAILLNPIATHVGVALTTNYNADRIWYWTAEFGSTYGSIEAQMREAGIRTLQPQIGATRNFTETVIFTWHWPLSLGPTESFVLYRRSDARHVELGSVERPISDERPFDYGISLGAAELSNRTGELGWFVQLENSRGEVLSKSDLGALIMTGQPPTPTPSSNTIPLVPTVAPTAFIPPVATPTPAPTLPPGPTALPTIETEPEIRATPTITTPSPSPLPPTETATPTITLTPSQTPTPTQTKVVLPTTESNANPTPLASPEPSDGNRAAGASNGVSLLPTLPSPYEIGPFQTTINIISILSRYEEDAELLDYFAAENRSELQRVSDILSFMQLPYRPISYQLERQVTIPVTITGTVTDLYGTEHQLLFTLTEEEGRWRILAVDSVAPPPTAEPSPPADG